MTILVFRGYRGAPSAERYVSPGKYDENDGRLFGLAGYLIENGHAITVVQEDDRGKSEVVKKVEEVAPVVAEPKPKPRRRSRSKTP